MQEKPLWEHELGDILKSGDRRRNLARNIGITPEDVESAQKLSLFRENVKGLRYRHSFTSFSKRSNNEYHPGSGYKNGYTGVKKYAVGDAFREIDKIDIPSPADVGILTRDTQLGIVGFCVGVADALLEDDKISRVHIYDRQEERSLDNLEAALYLYKFANVLGTKHAQRKLKGYAEKGPTYRSRLIVAMKQGELI